MSVRAFSLFGEIGLKNKASVELHKVDRDVHRTTKNLQSLTGSISVPGGTLSGLNSALGTLSNISNTIQGIPVIGSLITGAFSTVAGPVKDLATLGLSFNDLKENATLAFGVILKDGAKAEQLFGRLEKLGRQSPIFDTADLVRGAQRLLPVIGDGPKLIESLKGIGAMVAATGDLSSMPAVFRSMAAIARKPKLSAEEMSQELPDHGIDAWGLLARARGETVAQVMEKVSQGLLSGPGSFDVIVAQANREYGQLADLMGQTRSGKQLQLNDTLQYRAAQGTENLHSNLKQVQDRALTALQGPKGDALAGTINTVTGEIGGNLIKGFDSLTDGTLLGKMEKVGQDIKSGLGKGLDAAQTAMGHAGDYVVGFKTGIGSNSPATQFIPLGESAAEGFLIGFQAQMIAAGGPMSLFQNKGGAKLGGDSKAQRRAENEALAKHPAIQAMMDAIGVGEGTFNPQTGERNWMKWFGNARFTPGEEHPGISPVPFFNRKTGQWDRSSAAGGGQFLQGTWAGVEGDIGNLDFNNLHHQALAFVEKMRDRGMIGPLLRGDVRTAMALGNPEWASLDGSPHKQPTVSAQTTVDTFNRQLGVYSNTNGSITNSKPIPVTIVDAAAAGARHDPLGNILSGANALGMLMAGNAPGALAELQKQAQVNLQNERALVSGVIATANQSAVLARVANSTANPGFAAGVDAMTAGKLADVANVAQQVKDAVANPESLQAMKSATEAVQNIDAAITAATPAVEKLGQSAELTAEEIAANRKKSDLEGAATAKPKRDPLFDKAFTRAGMAGDFHGNFQSLLSGLGWEKPGNLGMQFLRGMIQSIQGRLAADVSTMLTGALFGGRTGADQPMTGGLLQNLFGSLFGGHRASGGPMSAGKVYVAGEHGRELIAMGQNGYAYNARETRGMMSGGGGENQTIVAFGDREMQEALMMAERNPRVRRTRVMNAKYMRLLQNVTY